MHCNSLSPLGEYRQRGIRLRISRYNDFFFPSTLPEEINRLNLMQRFYSRNVITNYDEYYIFESLRSNTLTHNVRYDSADRFILRFFDLVFTLSYFIIVLRADGERKYSYDGYYGRKFSQ